MVHVGYEAKVAIIAETRVMYFFPAMSVPSYPAIITKESILFGDAVYI